MPTLKLLFRWLLSKNKFTEAISVLGTGAKLNRRPLPDGFLRYSDGPLVILIFRTILLVKII